MLENRKLTLKITKSVMKSFTVRTVCTYMCLMFILPPTPKLLKSVTKSFHSEHSLHGHVAGVHTAAHPQTCEKCNKECYSKDSLHRCETIVHDQLLVSGEPVYEIRKFNYEVAYIPRLLKSVDEEFHSMHGHVANVPTANHPNTCEKCEKKVFQ